MAATQAVLGSAYTFQVLFVDGTNTPIAVLSPTIDIFSYSQTGVKQPLVTGGTLDPVTPAETGRYTYVFTVPTTFNDGDTIHAEMRGEDPATGLELLVGEDLLVISANRGLGCPGGLITNFIKGW